VSAPAPGRGVPSELAARLAAAARRCYPAAAVRFRLRGEALLAFCLGEDGAARSVAVARSSGSPLLDRAALECVLPGALPAPGAAGCFELPVRFARE
jgi:protein TonB